MPDNGGQTTSALEAAPSCDHAEKVFVTRTLGRRKPLRVKLTGFDAGEQVGEPREEHGDRVHRFESGGYRIGYYMAGKRRG